MYVKAVINSKTRPSHHVLVRIELWNSCMSSTLDLLYKIILTKFEQMLSAEAGIYCVYPSLPFCSTTVTFDLWFLQVNISPLLSHVTHDDFSSLILPALQKSLLRNPEVVLESKWWINYICFCSEIILWTKLTNSIIFKCRVQFPDCKSLL